MNIEYDKIRKFKEIDLPDLLTQYGHHLKKQSDGYVTKCPFHDDTNPSLSLNKKSGKWLWHCFGCNKGGTSIEYIMMREGLSLRETYQWFEEREGKTSKVTVKKHNNLELLKTITEHYHNNFLKTKRAVDYLKSRGITGPDIYKTFKIGYADGSMKEKISIKGDLIKDLKEIGVLTDKGGEFFYNSIVIPLYDEDGNVVSMYGRNIDNPRHLYLKGPHKGLVNRQGATGSEKLILTESIIDAISLYEMGVRNVIPCYGTNGFTGDHAECIRKNNINHIELAFDNDESGRRGAEALAEKLPCKAASIVTLPEGIKDINDMLKDGKTRLDYNNLTKEEIKRKEYQ